MKRLSLLGLLFLTGCQSPLQPLIFPPALSQEVKPDSDNQPFELETLNQSAANWNTAILNRPGIAGG